MCAKLRREAVADCMPSLAVTEAAVCMVTYKELSIGDNYRSRVGLLLSNVKTGFDNMS